MNWHLLALIAAVSAGGLVGMWLFSKFFDLPPIVNAWSEAAGE